MNVVAVAGSLSRPAEERVLASGTRLISYEVTTAGPEGKAETVPVVWFDPPASASGLDEGTKIVAVGRVRRRFFRTAAGVASRTEIVVSTLVVSTRTKAVKAALTAAAGVLSAE